MDDGTPVHSDIESEHEAAYNDTDSELDLGFLENTYYWLFKPDKDDSDTVWNFMRRRCPTFVDALRALGDALRLIHEFLCMPAGSRPDIPNHHIESCRRLTLEWQAYICHARSLKKVFYFEHGIYFQAEVLGEKITWSIPRQAISVDEVHYNLYLFFFKFYQDFLRSVNFHLYKAILLEYKEFPNPAPQASPADLYTLLRHIDDKLRVEDAREDLFKDMVFFLGDDVNEFGAHIESMVFIISAFGGIVSWRGIGAPYEESDQMITHQINHIPALHKTFPSRKYISKEWVIESINSGTIQPFEAFLQGRALRVSASPFSNNEEFHIPEYMEVVSRVLSSFRNQVRRLPPGNDVHVEVQLDVWNEMELRLGEASASRE